MTKEQLAELVQQMRQAQKDYFNSRTRTALDNAKKLEKKVDLAVQEILRYKEKQQSLF